MSLNIFSKEQLPPFESPTPVMMFRTRKQSNVVSRSIAESTLPKPPGAQQSQTLNFSTVSLARRNSLKRRKTPQIIDKVKFPKDFFYTLPSLETPDEQPLRQLF